MKKVITLFLFMFCSAVSYSQNTKTKDSLDKEHQLTHEQTLQVYSFNIELGKQERELQQKHANTDSLEVHMKKIQGKKDELYKSLLPNDKYQLFKQKKLVLLSSANEEIK